ncbi:fas-associated death domain protein-like isoform X2 [Teleopsis dalmanni]|uniref:fas-associated death domain protein-like isoform X2 n=1 Tax=Teleopsis dalmanni TaxID=139649 RepID=UPI0018CF666B|nr:fas-associated death domain protein-like isoform X2 [Teleopsis dalmanni]
MVDTQHWSYDLLKKIAAEQKVDHFEELKNNFKKEINSVRQPLQIIADYCNNSSTLHEALSKYEPPKEITAAEPVNQYQEMRLADELHHKLNISSNIGSRVQSVSNYERIPPPPPVSKPIQLQNIYSNGLPAQKRNAVFNLLSREIGSYWRRLGRSLEISEGIMDEIELQFQRDFSSRVIKLLEIFEKDECHDPNHFVLLLFRALENCQRKDLRRKIENILSY